MCVYCVCMCSDAIWSNMLLIPHSICEWENLLIFIVDWILIYCQTKPTKKRGEKLQFPPPTHWHINIVKLLSIKNCYIVTQFLMTRDLMSWDENLCLFIHWVECLLKFLRLPLHIQLQSNWNKMNKIKTETPPSTLCWWSLPSWYVGSFVFSAEIKKKYRKNIKWQFKMEI